MQSRSKQVNKRFIVRKYVMAASAAEAIRKERRVSVDDVWVDDEWNKANLQTGGIRVGFKKT